VRPRITSKSRSKSDPLRERLGWSLLHSRCAALVGDVGISTACAVYTVRPDVCRAFSPRWLQSASVAVRARRRLPPRSRLGPRSPEVHSEPTPTANSWRGIRLAQIPLPRHRRLMAQARASAGRISTMPTKPLAWSLASPALDSVQGQKRIPDSRKGNARASVADGHTLWASSVTEGRRSLSPRSDASWMNATSTGKGTNEGFPHRRKSRAALVAIW
jgi:hypothetical protein